MGRPVVAILGTRYRDFAIEEAELAGLDVEVRSGPGRTREEVLEVGGGAAVILAGSRPRFDDETLSRLTAVGIVRYGIGTETIDLSAARKHGVWVARVSDYATEAVAVHAVSLAMAAARRLVQADAATRSGRWGLAELRPLHLPSVQSAGILGYGRIGRHAARLLSAFGFQVLAHDLFAPVDDGVAQGVSLDELLAASDVLSLHVPASPDGRPLLDAGALARMRPGSVLVNTARGTLVDQDALVAALLQGRPGYAALDVFPAEPPDPQAFADVADRVLLTPHMAWFTQESEADLRRKAAREARRLLCGERPQDVVVQPATVAEER